MNFSLKWAVHVPYFEIAVSLTQCFLIHIQLIFPTRVVARPYSMLGLGDFVIPGMAFLVGKIHPITTSVIVFWPFIRKFYQFITLSIFVSCICIYLCWPTGIFVALALRFDVSKGSKSNHFKSAFSGEWVVFCYWTRAYE